MIGPAYTQVAIKTEKALRQLRFIRAERIERINRDRQKNEQDAYEEAFARTFESIMDEKEASEGGSHGETLAAD